MSKMNIGLIIFVFMGTIMLLISIVDKSGMWPFVAASLFGLGVLGWVMNKRIHGQELEAANCMQELARRTGLVFDRARFLTIRTDAAPVLYGEYRGFYIALSLVMDSWQSEIPRIFTRTSLMVDDGGATSLQIRERKLVGRKIRSQGILSGDEPFDHKYHAGGAPAEFVQHALKLILRHPRLFRVKPEELTLLVRYPLSWTSWSQPSITMENSTLVSLQHGVVTRVDHQKEHLDLLCDLAELAERQGKVFSIKQ